LSYSLKKQRGTKEKDIQQNLREKNGFCAPYSKSKGKPLWEQFDSLLIFKKAIVGDPPRGTTQN